MLSLLCVTAFPPTAAKADNPIVQHIYTADPAPLVYNGRVYLYTGHDEDNSAPTSFTMREWRGAGSPGPGEMGGDGAPAGPAGAPLGRPGAPGGGGGPPPPPA